jgi:hypothetical protein
VLWGEGSLRRGTSTLVLHYHRERVENPISLNELGRLEITRVSHIEFKSTTQREVKDRKGKVRFIAKSRAQCLEWEQQNLQWE